MNEKSREISDEKSHMPHTYLEKFAQLLVTLISDQHSSDIGKAVTSLEFRIFPKSHKDR